MPSPPVTLGVRIRGTAACGTPALNASNVTIGAPVAGRAYMVYPAGQGDLVWQGGTFGLSAPNSGSLVANVWRVAVTIGHFCTSPAAFTSVTAQIYDTQTSAVIASAPFTLSSTLITETITLTAGYPAADVPQLAARMVWHQTGVGNVSVQHAYAEISYSYSDSIGQITIAGLPSMPATAPAVTPPPVSLVASGAAVSSLSPAFGQATTAGDLLVGWVFSNSGSAAFDTTCSDPSWTLAGHAGAAFGWESLWYKPHCKTAETAPVFSSSGASQPLSQLLEFSNAAALDQAGAGTGTLTSTGADTASGDLVFAFFTWNGSNPGPTTITMTGTDSHGTALALTQADNHTSAGTQFWVTGWAQASSPAGPGADTVTATLGVFAGGGGVVASFKAFASSVTVPPLMPAMVNRVIVIPLRVR